MPVSIIPEASPAANLPFHWRTALTHSKTSIFILNSNTVVSNHTRMAVLLRITFLVQASQQFSVHSWYSH